jgi:subtilase family serine protease
MRGSIHPARLTRSRRAGLLAVALLLGLVLVAGCTGSSGGAARGAATPASSPASTSPAAARVVSGCLLAQAPVSCYAPVLFRAEYGIQPLLDSGIDGRGETVTVLDAAHTSTCAAPCQFVIGGPDTSDIRQDLAAFDREFRLPAARIETVTSLAGSGSPWQVADEEVADAEIVHAVAPAATLRLVLLPSNAMDSAATATADMIAGLRLAVSGTDVASIGLSLGEHYFTKAQAAQMHSILLGAAAHHVTVIAGSGDNGGFSDTWWGGTPVEEVSLPASDPLVLAVGGTTLTASPLAGVYAGETAWNGQSPPGGGPTSSAASGGGFSHLYARPAYQDGVPGIGAMRGVPDVAGEAYQVGSWPTVLTAGGKISISPGSGTSAAASLWGGLIALADQDAHHDLGSVNPAIYRIARSRGYHQAFHDITTGSNIQTLAYPAGTAGYRAGPGWDPVTGWGTPDAQVLVPLLARLADRPVGSSGADCGARARCRAARSAAWRPGA